MSTWWDPRARKYRSSLVYKVLYVWTWPVSRWVLHHMPAEAAHHLAIRAIPVADWIGRAWGWCVLLAVLPFLAIVRLLLFLPWFTWEEPKMVVKLTYTNQTGDRILLRSNMGTGQPVEAGQTLEMTFALEDKEDGVGDLILVAEPG